MHAEQWFLHFVPEGEELLDFILGIFRKDRLNEFQEALRVEIGFHDRY
jgi:hypothetical protein